MERAKEMAHRILADHEDNILETGSEDPAYDNNQGDGATLGRLAASRYRSLLRLARLVVEGGN